jgi:hypothetical protein
VTRDADARWLWNASSRARLKRDVKIGRGTHVLHLESGWLQLYSEVATFVSAKTASDYRADSRSEARVERRREQEKRTTGRAR